MTRESAAETLRNLKAFVNPECTVSDLTECMEMGAKALESEVEFDSLFCPVHLDLYSTGHLEDFSQCVQCTRNHKSEIGKRLALALKALREYRYAQRRMRDKWADGDEGVKGDLWRGLHACEAAADELLDGAL